MLALVAGTLRAYCRDQVTAMSPVADPFPQGIPYPPDVGCLVPVSCRNFLPVACGYPCDVLSFPLKLPLSVEGTIPRVWTVQKRLLEGLNGHVPAVLKIAQIAGECRLLPGHHSFQFAAVRRKNPPPNGCVTCSLQIPSTSPSIEPRATSR